MSAESVVLSHWTAVRRRNLFHTQASSDTLKRFSVLSSIELRRCERNEKAREIQPRTLIELHIARHRGNDQTRQREKHQRQRTDQQLLVFTELIVEMLLVRLILANARFLSRCSHDDEQRRVTHHTCESSGSSNSSRESGSWRTLAIINHGKTITTRRAMR